MKWFLVLWAGPIVLLASWYGLSSNDISFGIFMLTREAHDMVFRIYADALGIAPELIPPLVAKAIAVDSLIVFAVLALRRRKAIQSWWNRMSSASPDAQGTL